MNLRIANSLEPEPGFSDTKRNERTYFQRRNRWVPQDLPRRRKIWTHSLGWRRRRESMSCDYPRFLHLRNLQIIRRSGIWCKLAQGQLHVPSISTWTSVAECTDMWHVGQRTAKYLLRQRLLGDSCTHRKGSWTVSSPSSNFSRAARSPNTKLIYPSCACGKLHYPLYLLCGTLYFKTPHYLEVNLCRIYNLFILVYRLSILS